MAESTPDAILSDRMLLHTWCEAIIQGLSAAGVREVVISPGSRNTPLTLAALRCAELTCHSVIDERTAGFLALGMARASQKPVALCCTSGTAAAHYFPALIEASYDGIPLVIVSADRPEELQGCGAPQTINQRNLYGAFVRGALPLPSPRDSVEAFARLRDGISGLLDRAVLNRPGPVHLNVPLRKPLEPEAPASLEQKQHARLLIEAESGRVTTGRSNSAPDLGSLLEARYAAHRPLVTAGPIAPHEAHLVARLAAALHAPVLTEFGAPGSSGLEFSAPLLEGDQAPDFLLHVGPPAVSSTWSRLLEQTAGRYFAICGTEYREPSRRAEATIVGPLSSVVASLREATASARIVSLEPDSLEPLFVRSREMVRTALEAIESRDAANEPQAVHAILSSCPTSANVVLGNSLSLRLASWVWPSLSNPPQPYTARGVNGIDGTIAWATGIAVTTGRPTLALLGDVTFAHDVGSLGLLTDRELPLVLCVLDNRGGRIFDHLPIKSQLSETESRYWTTPTGMDFEAVARAFGIEYARPSEGSMTGHPRRIDDIIRTAFEAGAPTLVHVQTDPSSTKRFLARVRGALVS